MPEEELLDILATIKESIRLVQDRFDHIEKPEDFCTSSEGTTLLDAIAMRLQVIGEAVKQTQKLDAAFLDTYREIQWDKIARFREGSQVAPLLFAIHLTPGILEPLAPFCLTT